MSESLTSTPMPGVPQSQSTSLLVHVVEGVDDRLHFGGVSRGHGLAVFLVGPHAG